MNTLTPSRSTLPGMRKMRNATCPRITQVALRAAMIDKLGKNVSLRRFYVIECGRGRVLDSTAAIIAEILGCTVDDLKTGELEVRGRGRPKDPDPLSRVRRAVRTYGKEDLLAALAAGVLTRAKGAGGVIVRLLRDFPDDVTAESRAAILRDQINSVDVQPQWLDDDTLVAVS